MKILQLIDSLNPGGAERMALNYYLALKDRNIDSFLVVTREKGSLSKEVVEDSNFYFLNKMNRFDLKAFGALRRIIKKEQIDIVHAHGTSWFFAVLCKLSGANFKLIWHDHYGKSEFLNERLLQPVQFFSRYFDGIISVNKLLKIWASKQLHFKNSLIYLPNFSRPISTEKKPLLGNSQFKVICVANLRPQKDHFTLLKAFSMIQSKQSVSLHLIGHDPQTTYSSDLKKQISDTPEVFYYGEQAFPFSYIQSATLGVLSSNSEGLPLALIEYGLAGLPVVCTNVGECRTVVGEKGLLVPPKNPEKLAEKIILYLNSEEKAALDAEGFRKRINELYSETSILDRYFHFIQQL